MKKHLFLLTAICAFLFAACSGGKTPTGTVKTYMKAIQSKNFEKAIDCFDYDKSKADEAEMKSLIEKMEKSMDEQGGLKSYEILSETIAEDGNSATVKVTQTMGNGKSDEQEIKLKKVNEEWKIDLGK